MIHPGYRPPASPAPATAAFERVIRAVAGWPCPDDIEAIGIEFSRRSRFLAIRLRLLGSTASEAALFDQDSSPEAALRELDRLADSLRRRASLASAPSPT